jgi:hypothetical protein
MDNQLTRLTKSQLKAFAESFIMARSEWMYASRNWKKDPLFSIPIPLTKRYRLYNRNCNVAVLAAYDIFFTRISTGHSTERSAEVSRWAPRRKGVVMSLISSTSTSYELTMTQLDTLFQINKDRIVSVREHLFKKDATTFVKQYEFVFPDEAIATVFGDIAVKTWNGSAAKPTRPNKRTKEQA